MGNWMSRGRINPGQQQSTPTNSSIFTTNEEISRSNFKFITKISSSGINQEAILWLACNVSNPAETFFVKQYDKPKVYNHKRVQAVLDEMALLTQTNNPYFIRTYFAFQDYQSLYLVTEAIQSLEFSQLIGKKFSQAEAKYVIFALISIIEELHQKGFAFTELCPKNLHINMQTGELKLVQIINPAKIDSYCNSCVISPVSPYSAPQILLRDKVFAECDYYSLGIIIYEMMTQDLAFADRNTKATFDRSWLLGQNIEVEKSKIPEEWQPQSADFLIKLLIKNPNLRLGRYGSFEVKNHVWLKESAEHYSTKKGIDLQDYENVRPAKVEEIGQQEEDYEKKELISNYFFQQLFEGYKYQYKKEEATQNNPTQEHFNSHEKTSLVFNETRFRLEDAL